MDRTVTQCVRRQAVYKINFDHHPQGRAAVNLGLGIVLESKTEEVESND